MIEATFPNLYHKMDAESAKWQKRYLRTEATQLAALIAAAAVGAGGGPGYLVVIAFVVGLSATIYRHVSRADEKWWNGRAGAESAKTLSWRYVVGGSPFGIGENGAEELFARRLLEVAREVAKSVGASTSGTHISEEMSVLRRSDISTRVAAYRVERIDGQIQWYEGKSTFNDGRARWWAWGVSSVQGVGLCLAVLALVYEWPFSFVGFLTAVLAASAAWIAVKQHSVLARSYAVASNELALIGVEIDARQPWSEPDWALYVDDAEEAISREHTSWRATRGL